MVWLRKWLILAHRWLGVSLGLLFVLWFVSGIGMVFAGGMPTVTPMERLQRLPPLDMARVRLTPAEAAARAGLRRNLDAVTLSSVLDRPVYRFGRGVPTTVFADTGELLEIGDAESLAIAGRFLGVPPSLLRQVAVLDEADQWTIEQRRQLPLHKFAADDRARSELYVSETTGDVVVMTTRRSRALAWVAAIPHWLYFAPLRLRDQTWRRTVLWTSGVGTLAVFLGLVLAVTQMRTRYVGWMWWHYATGGIFGVFALTWVFSGLLSMEPWYWATPASPGPNVSLALSGGPLDLTAFASVDPGRWRALFGGRPIREVDFRRIAGEPYYVARGAEPTRTLVAARSLSIERSPFSVDDIVNRVRGAAAEDAGARVDSTELLADYDSYYRDRDRMAPLPALRMKLDDREERWVYVDPAMGEVVAEFTRRERIERWIYHGLHSLDFSFWYDNRPAWTVGVVALCSGGAALSFIGVVIGLKRVRRTI